MKKPIKIWIVLIILPVVLLIISGLLEILVQFTLNKPTTSTVESSSISALCQGASPDLTKASNSCDSPKSERQSSRLVVRIIQLLLGICAVLSVILEPLWITLLVMAHQHNKKLLTAPQPTALA